jgi:hypothetical protein
MFKMQSFGESGFKGVRPATGSGCGLASARDIYDMREMRPNLLEGITLRVDAWQFGDICKLLT